MNQSTAADLIAGIHFIYVTVVVCGLLVILLGGIGEAAGAFRLRFIRNFRFRVIHLAMILVVVFEVLAGISCPLTDWEYDLRTAAGQQELSEAPFVARLIHKLIFYEFPPIVFTVAYCLFGAVVLVSWWLIPPKFPWKGKSRCLLLFPLVLLFSGCLTPTDQHFTYELQGARSNYGKKDIFRYEYTTGWPQYKLVANSAAKETEILNGQKIKIDNYFDFVIYPKGLLDNGYINGNESGYLKKIHTEPYDLSMSFYHGAAQRIIFNKLIFRTKTKETDLLQIADLTINGVDIDEAELSHFRNYGIIDLNELNNPKKTSTIYTKILYQNADVIFQDDRHFCIDVDVSLEGENFPAERYVFTAKFTRKKFTDKSSGLEALLFLRLFI